MTFVQTPALALLSSTLRMLHRTAPDLRVEVGHSETAPGIDALLAHAVDLVVGVHYDAVPVARHRELDRQELLREDVLLAVAADDALARRRRIPLAAVADRPWAAGRPGTGHALLVDHVVNRLGGYAPDIRHRSDDGLILGAIVASGQAVTVLPALLAAAVPQIAARPIAEATFSRSIFTAARATAAASPSVVAVRDALTHAAAGR